MTTLREAAQAALALVNDTLLERTVDTKRLSAVGRDLEAALDAEPAQPVVWMHPDGRVVTANTMECALRDGGAMRSSLIDYTIPLYTAPQPPADTIAALLDERETFYMDYRIKCDEQTKVLHVEVERLKAERDALARDAATMRGVRDLVADGLTLSHSIMTGCRCMACYTYQFTDVDDKVVGEADHIEDAVRKAQAAMKGESDES